MIIAQLSDLHLSTGKDTVCNQQSRRAFKSAVAHIQSLRPAPAIVLITGDIAENGAPEEYETFKNVAENITCPVLVIPGNHDRRDAMLERLRGTRYWHFGEEDKPEFCNVVYDGLSVRLVGLDTLVAGAPHGELSGATLDWLDVTLSAQPERETLLFMHHPPFATGISSMDKVGLRNPGELAAILKRHKQVTRIVCGHVHRPIFSRYADREISIAPAPSRAVALRLDPAEPFEMVHEPPALHLHLWRSDTGFVTHISYIVDPV